MNVIKLVGGLVAICWLGIATFFYFTQGSLLYQPRPADSTAEAQLMTTLPSLQAYLVTTSDEQTLTGWYLPRRRGRAMAPALVYFGDNDADASDVLKQEKLLSDVSIVSMNYRGYGHSTGVPGEKALKEDALAVYDKAVAETGGQGFVMGRGLGSALAAYVASNRPVLGAVLVSPFDSLLAVAKAHYPFLPVAWLLKERYDTIPDAQVADVPALFISAPLDGVIPEERSQALYEAWKGSKRTVSVPLAGHEDIDQYQAYAQAVPSFIQEQIH